MKKSIISLALILTACNSNNSNNSVTPNNNNGNNNNPNVAYANTFTLTDGSTYRVNGPGIDSSGNTISMNEYKTVMCLYAATGGAEPVSRIEIGVGSPFSTIYPFHMAFRVKGSANQTTGVYSNIVNTTTRTFINIAGDGLEYLIDSALVNISELTNNNSYGENTIKGTYQLWLRHNSTTKTVSGSFDCKEAFLQ